MESGLIPCAGCKESFNASMRACPHCGAERVLPVHDADIDCPLCRRPLEETDYLGERIDVCPGCRGLWLDKPELEKLTSERSALLDPGVPYAFRRGPLETRTAYLPCPRCRGLMVRKNFRGVSGVIIDWCGEHGAWFDERELEQIRAFVGNGGIDRSQDRDLAATREELGGLKARVGDLEMMEKLLHKWELGRYRYRRF